MKKLIVLLFYPLPLLSEYLKICYDVKALSYIIGFTCIHYEIDKQNHIYFFSNIDSNPAISWIHKINNFARGHGNAMTLKSRFFYFDQKEGSFKEIQENYFEDNTIKVITHKFKKNKKTKIEEQQYQTSQTYYDPFILSLILFQKVYQRKGNVLYLFHKRTFYEIAFRILGEEVISIKGRNFNTLVIGIDAEKIRGTGFLVPVGEWKLYIEKDKYYLVFLEAGFTFLNIIIKMNISDIKGNENLISGIIKKNPE